MRDPKRIDRILGKLRALWLAYPDLRLGQLIINLTPPEYIQPNSHPDPFYIEDDRMEEHIDKLLKEGW